MKVIEHGITYKEKRCVCKALLSYCEKDLFCKHYITKDVYVIICPECGYEITIRTIDKNEDVF